MAVLPAHLVATPVLERLDGEADGVVLGAGATAAWVDLDGFVVAITTREVPLLPNAVALAAGSGTLERSGLAPGSPARVAPGRIDLGPLRIAWSPADPPAWDPTVPIPRHAGPKAVAERGAALRTALGAVDNGPHLAGHDLLDPDPAGLVGELAKMGLATAIDPEGAAGLNAPVPGCPGARPGTRRGGRSRVGGARAWAHARGGRPGGRGRRDPGRARPGDRDGRGGAGRPAGRAGPGPGRTTALSATLLALASERRLAEPAGRLLDLGPGGETAWPGALSRLGRLGHGSGRAYAAGIAATASLLAAGAPVR